MSSFNVGAAGAFASGISRGVNDFQADQERAQIMGERKQLMDQRTRRLSLEDASLKRDEDDRLLEQESMGAMTKVIDEDRAAYEKAPAPLGVDGQPAAKAPYAASKEAILRAAHARQNFYFSKGRGDKAIALDKEIEPMRADLKRSAAQGMLDAMATGGDITPAMRAYDALNNDGYEIADRVKSIKQPDGTTAYKVTRKNRFTGATEPEQVLSQQQLVQAMAANLSKPEEVGKFNQSMLLEAFKQKNKVEEEGLKKANKLEVEGVEQKGRMALVGARGAEDRKTDSAKDGGGTTDNNIKTVKQADNAIETVRRRMKDIETSIKDIDLGGTDSIGMSGPQRRATVTNNQDWQNANKRLGELNTLRDSLMKGGGLANAPGAKPGKRIKLDINGNVVP